ncbi:MAG: hypothetical protein AAF604_01460 [Acidobacteriota bacterium]
MTGVLLLAVLTVLLGRWAGEGLAAGQGAAGDRWAVEGAVGLVQVHVILLLFDLAGWRWHPMALTLVFFLLVGLWTLIRQRSGNGRPVGRLPATEAAFHPPALAAWGAVALYGFLAVAGRIDLPDFVYHWGIKAHRAYLAQGTDFAYLADPLDLAAHPDYPNLVPNLYGLTYTLGGGFDVAASMLWSVLLFAAMVLSAQEACRRLAIRGFGGQVTVGLMAVAVAMFGIGYRIAGGADWFMALAPLLALPALLVPRGLEDDLRLGAAAALAAGAKIEGPALAAVLALVWLIRRWRSGTWRWGGAILTLAPAALVVVPWLALNLRHDLFQTTNTGWPDLSRGREIALALVEILNLPEWHFLPWVLLLLPVLLGWRSTRAIAWVCTGQLAFYLFVYFTAPVDVGFYVRSSFPRLLFHLVPVLLVASALWLQRADTRQKPLPS